MLTFKYEARNATTGEKIKAEVQAESEQAASHLIRANGLSPLSIAVVNESSKNPLSKFANRIKTKDKILFSRQLSTLINAGLPLLQALRNVNDQTTSKPFQILINHVISDIEGGASFSVSLAKHPETFNRIYLSLVAAGEASGTLDSSLERVANQQEKDAEVLSKIRGALIYPAIVMVVMFIVLAFMIVKVLPQVQVLYDGIPGAKLPLITVIMLAIAHFVINYWWIVIVIVVGGGVTFARFIKTSPGKRLIDHAKMHAWPIKPLFMELYMARFTRMGTTLVSSGVPLLQMLEITAEAINNVHIEASIDRAIEKVRGGKSLADSLEGDGNFLPLVPNMLRIGEQSGSMEQMMAKAADYYEKELDNQVKAISTIIEPVLMVVMGVAAFIIVAAVLLPIYGLAGQNLGT
ncbi:MAG: type II secretion system F family protein [Candidatus Saccharibacteria bacterium]